MIMLFFLHPYIYTLKKYYTNCTVYNCAHKSTNTNSKSTNLFVETVSPSKHTEQDHSTQNNHHMQDITLLKMLKNILYTSACAHALIDAELCVCILKSTPKVNHHNSQFCFFFFFSSTHSGVTV